MTASEASCEAMSDNELLGRWAAGCQAAGGMLIDRHFAAVHRFFRNKVRSESDVEDLVQQTLLSCLDARARFRQDGSFRSFLLGIARLQLFSHYRSAQRSRDCDFGVTSLRDLGTSPSRRCIREEDERLLSRALVRLPLDVQIILELTYYEGLDGPEIARVLEVPLNTAYSRMRRARQSLSEMFETLASDRAPPTA